MARPLRLEFAGALYHITSRGDRRDAIYRAADDREAWLEVLGNVCARFNWVVHAYCQMTNHYHVLVETIDGNLSRGMRQLNGRYTQRFNRRHGLVGHVLQESGVSSHIPTVGVEKVKNYQKQFLLQEEIKTPVAMQGVQKVHPARPQGFWRAERTAVRGHDKSPRTPLAGIFNILLSAPAQEPAFDSWPGQEKGAGDKN